MPELVRHVAERIQGLGRRAMAALRGHRTGRGEVQVLAVVPARRISYRYLNDGGPTLRIEIELPYCPAQARGASGCYRLAGVGGEAREFFVSVRFGGGDEGVPSSWIEDSEGATGGGGILLVGKG